MKVLSRLLFLTLGVCTLAVKQPNILWILADDLDNDYKQDRLAIMPNLKRLREAGVHFINHVAAQPVCGPSRSSLLQGRYPHNVGYYANDDPPSIANYLAVANNSVGTWLTAAGYHTAFIGKYVNGAEFQVPSGWNFWGAFSTSKGTYNYYNSTPYNITFDRKGEFPITPVVDVPMTGIHQASYVGAWGVEQMKIAAAAGLPFFVHTTATMIHEGTCYGPFKDTSKYALDDPFWESDLTNFGCNAGVNAESCAITISACPSDKHKHDFDDLPVPHVPSWNKSASGPLPKPMQDQKSPPLTAYQSSRQDKGYRNRSASAVDLDDMIGVLLKGIEDLGVADNTYVIFTSDNGFHLGEHRLLFGKEHPYETDVSLPLYIRGPAIPPNSTLLHPTNHLDITATVVELAGATPKGPPLDGKSFLGALGPTPILPAQWRDFSFTEHFENQVTWQAIRRPLDTPRTKFHLWCDSTMEVFNLDADEWEMANMVEGGEGARIAAKELPLAVFLGKCSGQECSAPTPETPKKKPLACKNTTKGVEGWW